MGKYYMVGTRPKRIKWIRRIVIAFVVYTIVGFFVVPTIIKSQMLKRLPALTKRQAAVEQVKFNPYALSLTIRGFSLKETNGDVFTSFDEFYINFQPIASLFKLSWVFDEISLKKPFAQVTYREDGTFNFANLITNSPAPSAPAKPQPLPRLTIYNLSVTNGAVAFADLKRKEPFHTEFIPINVNLTNLTTIRDKNSPYMFIARTDSGESFAWSGTVSINPLRSAGKFRLGGLQLGKYSPYSHDYASFEITNGLLNVAADYHYDSVTNMLDLIVSNAAVGLLNLELKTPDTGETVIAIPGLVVSGVDAGVVARTAHVGSIKSSGGSLLVRQNHDGSINLLSALKLPASEPSTNTAAADVLPWSVKIDEIAFDNYAIKAEDKKPGNPASFDIDQLGFDLKGVSNASNAPVSASLSLRFAQTGSIAVNGTATLIPPSADLEIALTNIDLRPIQPYVQEQLKLAITGGAVDLHGHARYAPPDPSAPLINFTGSVAVTNFATADGVLFKDFAKWDLLTVDGIKLDMQPDKLRVDQVKITRPNFGLVVGPDRRINLLTILRNQIGSTNAVGTNVASTNTTAETAQTSAPKKNIDVALGALVLENASIHFTDQSLEPHCSFDVQEFGGTIQGLSSQAQTTATVDMKGKVDDRSPFSVTGKINPLAKDIFADVTVTFTNTELTAFTPYTEKYAGRPLQKGKLSFSVHYLIETNVLKAENGFYVDQLTLGAKNNSPDATSLPVKLAIALLKDRNGRIQLDVPVTGHLNDPKFRVGPIIWHVVVNLIEKAATSPFSLLGAMFGGGGEELSFVSFDPGYSTLLDSETNKLDTLAKALYARPELTLEITGSADPATDHLPLARIRVDQQIKSLWVKEQTDSGKPAVAVDQVKLDPADYERLLRKIYKKIIGRYQPTPVATNDPAGSEAQSIAAKLAALPKPDTSEREATRLMSRSEPARPEVKSPSPAAVSTQPAVPQTRAELELADMREQLAQKTAITNDDLRDLMQQRASEVQAYLLKTGKVTADRLFLIAPKPLDDSFKGQDRVNLSLD